MCRYSPCGGASGIAPSRTRACGGAHQHRGACERAPGTRTHVQQRLEVPAAAPAVPHAHERAHDEAHHVVQKPIRSERDLHLSSRERDATPVEDVQSLWVHRAIMGAPPRARRRTHARHRQHSRFRQSHDGASTLAAVRVTSVRAPARPPRHRLSHTPGSSERRKIVPSHNAREGRLPAPPPPGATTPHHHARGARLSCASHTCIAGTSSARGTSHARLSRKSPGPPGALTIRYLYVRSDTAWRAWKSGGTAHTRATLICEYARCAFRARWSTSGVNGGSAAPDCPRRRCTSTWNVCGGGRARGRSPRTRNLPPPRVASRPNCKAGQVTSHHITSHQEPHTLPRACTPLSVRHDPAMPAKLPGPTSPVSASCAAPVALHGVAQRQ